MNKMQLHTKKKKKVGNSFPLMGEKLSFTLFDYFLSIFSVLSLGPPG